MASEEGAFRFLGDDTLVLRKPPNSHIGACGRTLPDEFFKVHRVLPPSASQRAVFEEVSQLVTACVDGYTVAVTAYGQTGSGKTFSMLGLPSKPGIIPRAVRQLISQCQQRAPVWRYRISMAVVQIYKEVFFDLLTDGSPTPADQTANLPEVNLHDNGRQILLRGCLEVDVNTEDEVLEEIRKARVRRQASATALNVSPGFLHFIVLLRVRGACASPDNGALLHECGRRWQSNPEGRVFHATLNSCQVFEPTHQSSYSSNTDSAGLTTMSHGLLVLADLAGFDSWPIPDSKSMCTCPGSRLKHVPGVDTSFQMNAFNSHRPADEKNGTPCVAVPRRRSNNRRDSVVDDDSDESRYLGRSLTNLTRVFDCLSVSSSSRMPQRHHIPYRDSTLTHLLKPALIGDAKFLLLVTLNSQRSCLAASLRSLQLASKASRIALGRATLNRNSKRGICTSIE